MPDKVAPATEVEAKLPPTVQVVKTASGCSVVHNLTDPWFAIALLEMAKDALLKELKPTLLKPGDSLTGLNGLRHRMGR